jgi:Uma2 family endonuclease
MVAEYHRMGEAGILTDQDRVELIEGERIAMAPVGPDHSGASVALDDVLNRALRGRGLVSVRNPVRLGDDSEPRPDVMVLKPRPDYHQEPTPLHGDVLLLIELAKTSLAFDRAVKLPLYALHGIPEYWIVDLRARMAEVYRTPAGDVYADADKIAHGTVAMQAFPDVEVPVADLFRGGLARRSP